MPEACTCENGGAHKPFMMSWRVSQDFTAEEKGSSWKGERDADPDMEEALADGAVLPPSFDTCCSEFRSSYGGRVF